MFRLEKLEISGFKSFADRTSLVFGEGITGVVGPNGCGKSNIAEAISWVLGEQSAKNLRGGKMEDVIFSGARDRKPTGMAEVLLTMVAIEDIAARDVDQPESTDEEDFDQALNNAHHAAEAARALVDELAPPEENAAVEESAVQSSSEQSSIEIDQPAESASVPADAAEAVEPESETSFAEVRDDPSVGHLEAPAPPNDLVESSVQTDSQDSADAEEKKPRKRRSPRPPKRRRIAISAGERITVGRRLYRTGDSDYLMNGRPCLLRDIQDLFAGTGLGGAHYAIIEQGRIGQILSSKPLDRRALIEEAAGITKFKSRKRATELKLESAKQNLTRLNDIISEVERQVNSLKRQAQKARRYRRLREEMRSLLKIVFTADYYRLNKAIERVAVELEEAERNQMALDARLSEHEGDYKTASARARTSEDHLAELRERAAAVELEADRVRNRRAFEEQQINELTVRIEEVERDQRTLDERLSLLDAEAQRRAAALQLLESEVAAERNELEAREVNYQEELGRSRAAESEIEALRQRLLAEIGATERLRNLRISLDDTLRRLDLKQVSLNNELARAVTRRDDASVEFARAHGEAETNSRQLSELNSRISLLSTQLETLRDYHSTVRSQLEATRARLDTTAHRLASLEDLDAHHAYYSDTVQHVLSREQATRINALGTLADFVEVEPQYERLIESLFARELQSVLVPTIDDALVGVDYIKTEALGRGAFLVVGLHGGEGDPDEMIRDAARIQGEYVTEDRQLPPADPASVDAIVIPLNLDADRAFSEFEVEPADAAGTAALPGSPTDDRAAMRKLDEEAASRFQLDVLRAIDLLGVRREIKSVVERAFPDKCAAAVVPDIEAALHLSIENPTLIYVTYDGEQVVNGRLIMTGAQAGRQDTSLLALKREIKELREQKSIIAEEERQRADALRAAEERLRLEEAAAGSLDRQIREHEKSAAGSESHLEGLRRDLERAEQHVRVVDAELEQTATERGELETRIEQLGLEVATAESSLEAVQNSLEETTSRFAEMRATVEELSGQLSAVRASVAARSERLNAARTEMRRAESEAEELRGRINRNRLELYDSHGRIDALTTSLQEGSGAAAQFEQGRASLAELIDSATEDLASARARTDELERIVAELRQEVGAARDRRGQFEVERARVESEAAHLSRTCFSELAMTLEDVVTSVELAQAATQHEEEPRREGETGRGGEGEILADDPVSPSPPRPLSPSHPGAPPPSDIELSRAHYDELRLKLDEIGPVNMMALEELDEADERFRFMSEQRRDILDSIKMTEEALTEIKKRSRERFRNAFTHINENFQRMFVELFGGGRGEMILIDEDDVLESGIDLIAQPPGKRLQNVLLLSGGEKAMAAIALVLAIFQYRPSPFCILDEVDAPLDEVNVGRFAEKVMELSRDTQFLMITHNKRTMEAARALYGVTMQEPGISKLVSVKFE